MQEWPEGNSEQLQDCFSCTDWTIFEDDNIGTYTSSVLFYIKCCMDNVTTTKQICAFPNNKLVTGHPTVKPEEGHQGC